jgi:serine protease Do
MFISRVTRRRRLLAILFLVLSFFLLPWGFFIIVKSLPKAFDRTKSFVLTTFSCEKTGSTKYEKSSRLFNTPIVREESKIIDVVDEVSPAVVSVVMTTVNFDFFSGPSLSEEGIGTGFIVDASGLIVTNSHVVDDMSVEYSVVLTDGSTYDVDKIHRDPFSDLAILEITGQDLPVVELGDSDSARVGQVAIAIGNALGRFQNTVTVGVVSGIARQLQASSGLGESKLYENVIQTDAALNPGNSGGPLLNSSGQVVGVNVATSFGADNISFAIPVNVLRPILTSFIENGRIIKPYLGVSYTMVTKDIAALRKIPEGAFVSRIMSDSPADNAGLKRGDIIMKIGDTSLGADASLAAVVSRIGVGESVTLTVARGGDELFLETILAEMPGDF